MGIRWLALNTMPVNQSLPIWRWMERFIGMAGWHLMSPAYPRMNPILLFMMAQEEGRLLLNLIQMALPVLRPLIQQRS